MNRSHEIQKIFDEGYALLGKEEQLIPMRCAKCETGKVEVPRSQLYDENGALKEFSCTNHEA